MLHTRPVQFYNNIAPIERFKHLTFVDMTHFNVLYDSVFKFNLLFSNISLF